MGVGGDHVDDGFGGGLDGEEFGVAGMEAGGADDPAIFTFILLAGVPVGEVLAVKEVFGGGGPWQQGGGEGNDGQVIHG